MVRFLAVLAVFLIAHVIPAMPAIRRSLQGRLGEGGFIAAYSVLSLLLFTWLIREALVAPYIPLWFAGDWGYWVALVGVPLALLLLGMGVLVPNPLSIAFVTRPYAAARPGAVALTRHPILWGLGLWGLAHLAANGHLVGLILFGGLGTFALIGMLIVEGRRHAVLGATEWARLAAATSFLPFVALLRGRARWPRDGLSLAGGAAGLLLAGALLAGGHLWLFGRDPLGFL
ncbi:MAG: NnrU family protein [Gammaproteobacteria bacterium]